jgi:hypothetical protein
MAANDTEFWSFGTERVIHNARCEWPRCMPATPTYIGLLMLSAHLFKIGVIQNYEQVLNTHLCSRMHIEGQAAAY